MKKLVFSISIILMLTLSACNFPLARQNNDPAAIQTAVALNVAMTQISGSQTAMAGGAITPSIEIAADTPTVTLTPLPTLTPTPQGVWLTVLENTNCRSGPGTFYDWVTQLNAGVKVEAIGRNPSNNYYYVRNPNSGGAFCWLWDNWSSVAGNIAILPVFTPMPTPTITYTPTPAAGVDVSYQGLASCGPQFAIKVKVKNTGSVTWQSVRLFVKDNTSALNFTHTSDTFKEWSGCVAGLVQADLTQGEDSLVLNVNPGQFNYNPTGHSLEVTVTVYSADGLAGTSLSKTFTVTP